MSTQNDYPRLTFASNADLSGKQYYIVKLTAAGTVGLASAATDKLIGVQINKPNAKTGSPVEVLMRNAPGKGKVAAGAAVSINTYITADSTGRAITTTTSADQILGLAITAAAAAGDVIEYIPMTDRI